ncbi:hypothetical protein ACFX2C_013608 [Malus domestica]
MRASIKISTQRSFRNQRGARSEIEEMPAFSKAGLLKNHRPISEIEEALAFFKRVSTYHMHSQLYENHGQFVEASITDIEEALAFQNMSAPVKCTLSFAEITSNLSKISGEVEST